MTSQHDAGEVPEPDGGPRPDREIERPARQHSRTLLALVAAGTVAVAPLAGTAIGPAGGGQSAHSSPIYLLALASHDVGHNEWAYEGGFDARISWAVTYLALGLFWLLVTLWMRYHGDIKRGEIKRGEIGRGDIGGCDIGRRDTAQSAPSDGVTVTKRLWLKTLGAAWGAEFLAAALVVGGATYAEYTSTAPGPFVLRLIDVCSPWWSAFAALLVVARAERDKRAMRAALGYGLLLAFLLLVPVPGPDVVKILVLAVPAAVGALLDRRPGPAARESRPVTLNVGAAG
ncbi:MAG: hypothetical protein ACRDVE_07000 [Actinocrinis sp.]